MENKESVILTKWKDAKVTTGIMTSLLISTISMAVCMVVSFLRMLFESGDDGRRTCFFDTIYFESITADDGAVNIAMGFTGETFPIVFWFVAVFLFCFLSFGFAKILLGYRQSLIDGMKDTDV